MASSIENPPLLYVGQIFSSVEEARDTVLDISIVQKLPFKVKSSDQTRFTALCRAEKETGCPFYVRIAAQARTGEIELRKLIQHTCDVTDHSQWKRRNSSKRIASRHNDIIKADLKIKPHQIQNIERLNLSNQLSYLQAWRARKEVRKTVFKDREESYQLIYPFLESITDRGLDDDNGYSSDGDWAASRANAAIARDSQGQFEWCHLAPRACTYAFRHGRPFICLDGTHMKSETGLVLLIISTFDANENILPLMFGFYENESKDSWREFLYGFREYFIDNIGDDDARDYFQHLTIISDRAKGLMPAVGEVFPKAFHYYCTQHLAENVGNEFGKKVEKLFRAASLVERQHHFRELLDKIESLSTPARCYIDQINAKNFATSAAPLADFPRYGQTCSNIAESVNSTLMEARELPLLYAIHHIWTWMMRKFYERRHNKQHHEKFTNFCMEYYKKELEDSNQYLVTPQERVNQIAMVHRTQISDKSTQIVQLKAGKCSCLAFQDHKIPCRHAIAAARFFGVEPLSLIADFYGVSEYRKQYKYSLIPTLLSNLEPDGITKPPPAPVKSSGRKVTKRLRRITRETEARRFARMKSPDTQRRRQEEARSRYQSGASHFQVRASNVHSLRRELSAAYSNPQAALQRQTRCPEPFPVTHTPDLTDTWARIRALQASAAEFNQRTSLQRTAMNQSAGDSGGQTHNNQRITGENTSQPQQPQSSNSTHAANSTPNPSANLNQNQQPLLERSTSPHSSPSTVTYNFQGPVNGFIRLSGSASIPQFTQNISPSPPQKRKRPETEEHDDDDDDELEIIDPVIRRSTRKKKRSSRLNV
jgi:hypothetical protein